MSHTEQNPNQQVIAIIPARFSSTRLPGKLLLPLAGKPLILHTLAQAQKAANVTRAIVATDDEAILQTVLNAGGAALLTKKKHQRGSDRVAEVAANLPANSIIVNVQGDEPLIPVSTIERAVAAMLADDSAEIVTTCERIENLEDVFNPNAVKVAVNQNGFAVYFSRSPIPFPRDAANKYGSLREALRADSGLLRTFRKHTGLYVYRQEYLLKFTRLAASPLEKSESLEQLRALENGARIKVVEASESSIGVDTPEDFERVKELLEAKQRNPEEAAKTDLK